MTTNQPKPRKRRMVLDKVTKDVAMIVAGTVRNAMETFHVKHLTDEQMAELNPIIRNAIATALYAFLNQDDPRCRYFVQFQQMLIPDYWEPPELLSDLTETTGRYADRVRWTRDGVEILHPEDDRP
jgi:hypothetical protein